MEQLKKKFFFTKFNIIEIINFFIMISENVYIVLKIGTYNLILSIEGYYKTFYGMERSNYNLK